MYRNFEKFKKDSFYIYYATSIPDAWVSDMKKVVEHIPRKCIQDGADNYSAHFSGLSSLCWNWKDNFDNWIKVFTIAQVFKKGNLNNNIVLYYKDKQPKFEFITYYESELKDNGLYYITVHTLNHTDDLIMNKTCWMLDGEPLK
jgi:hypothetical protein